MRLECEEPGFESAYLDVETARWLRGEVETMQRGAATDAWYALVRRKVTAVCLPALEGDALTLPEHLTPANLDRIDYVLWNWFVWAVTEAAREVIRLGNAPWRRSLAMRETTDA